MTTELTIEWPGVFEKWSKNFVFKNYWRVSRLMDQEDALQECAVVFSECKKRYIEGQEGRVDNAAWFMSLYQTCLRNHFNLLSRRANHSLPLSYVDRIEITETCESEGPLLASLSEMPKEAKEVLRKIAEAPSELLGIVLSPMRSMEAWSRKMCRMTGTNLSDNVIREFATTLGRIVKMSDTVEHDTNVVEEKNVFEEVHNAILAANPGFKNQGKREEDEKFIARLLESTAALTEEQFGELSPEAKAWFDDGCAKFNAQEKPNMPAGFVSSYDVTASEQKEKRGRGRPKKAEGGTAVKEPPAMRTPGSRGRQSSLPKDAIIRVVAQGDLCRPEAKGYERLKVIYDGMTVGQALDAGVFSADLTYLRDTTKKIAIDLPN